MWSGALARPDGGLVRPLCAPHSAAALVPQPPLSSESRHGPRSVGLARQPHRRWGSLCRSAPRCAAAVGSPPAVAGAPSACTTCSPRCSAQRLRPTGPGGRPSSSGAAGAAPRRLRADGYFAGLCRLPAPRRTRRSTVSDRLPGRGRLGVSPDLFASGGVARRLRVLRPWLCQDSRPGSAVARALRGASPHGASALRRRRGSRRLPQMLGHHEQPRARCARRAVPCPRCRR